MTGQPAMKEHDVIQVDYEGLRSFVDRFPENKDVFDRLAYLWDEEARREKHFLILEDERKIIAAGSVRNNPKDESELWLTHVSVDPEYKNHGNGTAILRDIFNYAVQTGQMLAPSAFQPEGYLYLAPVMARLHQQFPDLKVIYKEAIGGTEPVTGAEPYELVKPDKWSTLHIRKLSDPPIPTLDDFFKPTKRARVSQLLNRLRIRR
jgi:GNAT superfamily N-acetyltransferase